jgi:hypothetical protein
MTGKRKASTQRSLEAEMRQLGRRLDKLVSAARHAEAGLQARSRVQLRKLQARQAAAQQALRRLGRQSAAASGPLKAGVRKAWRDIDSAVRLATQRFRRTA